MCKQHILYHNNCIQVNFKHEVTGDVSPIQKLSAGNTIEKQQNNRTNNGTKWYKKWEFKQHYFVSEFKQHTYKLVQIICGLNLSLAGSGANWGP